MKIKRRASYHFFSQERGIVFADDRQQGGLRVGTAPLLGLALLLSVFGCVAAGGGGTDGGGGEPETASLDINVFLNETVYTTGALTAYTGGGAGPAVN
ncbi:MAG: hypothetical protein V3S29_09745, partial [bacterium]